MTFQSINFEYPKPENFDEKNPEFDLFKHLPIHDCPTPKVEVLKNVRISSNSVVFNYFKIFKQSCITEENYKQYSRGYKFFFKYIFPKLNFRKKRFLLITDEWTSNYYHWHIFALSRLLVLKEAGMIENSLLFLPKIYQRYPFVLPSLEKFGIKKNQIVFLQRKSNMKVRELVMADVPHQHPELFKELTNVLLQNTPESKNNFGDKIYISREGQSLRFVENENEVLNIFEKYGFKKVLMDRLSYPEQVAISAKAKYIVSPHGAGLTNFLFAPKNAAILEMATKPDDGKTITVYYQLATMLGLKYFYLMCEAGDNSKIKDFHHATLRVDPAKLEKNLQFMLNS